MDDFFLEPEDDTPEMEVEVLQSYLDLVDPELIEAGWNFEVAKSTGYGKIDQPMVSHVRNAVFAVAQTNLTMDKFDDHVLTETQLRLVIASLVVHDIHKLDESKSLEDEFDIEQGEVNRYIESFNLQDFVDHRKLGDILHAAVVDHHNTKDANQDSSPPLYNQIRPWVRLGDAFASKKTPSEAASIDDFDVAYPRTDLDLYYHTLDDSKGISTSILNRTVTEVVPWEPVLVFDNGALYIGDENVDFDDDLVDNLVNDFKKKLRKNIETAPTAVSSSMKIIGAQNMYGVDNQMWFYAGPDAIVGGFAMMGTTDGGVDDDLTSSGKETTRDLMDIVPVELDQNRQLLGMSRFVNSIRSRIIRECTEDVISTTLDVFGVHDETRDKIYHLEGLEDFEGTTANKWKYSWILGQELIDREVTSPQEMKELVVTGLDESLPGWRDIVVEENIGYMENEISEYMKETLILNGAFSESETVDYLSEYGGKNDGMICNVCNRTGVNSRSGGIGKGDMKAKKGLTKWSTGSYTHFKRVGSNSTTKSILCSICQIEFSLRNSKWNRYEDSDELYFHLIPDHYYTPLSWRAYDMLLSNLSGERKSRLLDVAEAIRNDNIPESFQSLTQEDHGRQMLESMADGFYPDTHYNSQTIVYNKPKDNDTEFQFFGVFVGLALASYSGLRVSITNSPVPDMRYTDFDHFAHIGIGVSSIKSFYGEKVKLVDLSEKLNLAAAMIRVGNKVEANNDGAFAEYLRVLLSEYYPGSYLIERAADDGKFIRRLSEDVDLINEHGRKMSDETIPHLAELAFDVVRPTDINKSGQTGWMLSRSIEALIDYGGPADNPERETAIAAVSGFITESIDRTESVYPVKSEDTKSSDSMRDRIDDFAEFFVDELYMDICEGDIRKLKSRRNSYLNAFRHKVRELQYKEWDQ